MNRRNGDLLNGLIDPIIEFADRALYIAVAAFFVVAAAVLGVHAVIVFVQHLGKPPVVDAATGATESIEQIVVDFINALLLVLIILEVLSTVRGYLQNGATSLTPFLYIGIISATRRILAIGAEAALQNGSVSNSDFRRQMIDLGVNGAVVLVLALAVFLLRRGDRAEARAREAAEHARPAA
jgi:uncharacterized membrane protein (DUF373 family)